jgi:hypothetical protein
MSADADLPAQLAAVGAFLGQASLGKTVADLEIALADCDRNGVAAVAAEYGVTVALLRAAIVSREALGKISDLTHAAAITLSLEHILESGEKLVRPSLAAGNTKARLSDVETDRRVAEFKLARWTGADGARQKSAVKDLARLAVESSPRVAELYVRGPRPIAWLRRTKSSVRQQLKGFPAQLAAFEKSFDDPSVAVSTFVANAAAHVTLIDVEDRLPELFAPGAM